MNTSGKTLLGKVSLVTGGNGGIGFSMALGLAKAGSRVVIAGRNVSKGAEAVRLLEQTGGTCRFIELDISDESACAQAIEDLTRSEGRLDILVNNAGINVRRAPEIFDLDDWHRIIQINLTAAFVCAKSAYPALKASGNGKIINIGSMTSIFGASFAPAYGASKGGIVQLTRSLAVAWAKDNIQVNAILPGWIDTDLGASARQEVEGLDQKVMARTPAGRWGLGEDFEGITAFLAGPGSNFITGTAIPVDGGYSISG
ncbi:SDR family NAD(P)-dependent oxidoreductase [Agrobacterium vitis]|uniref:SDR family NAD(P)-dependent oxidoreductase n=1 Tax=Agrobacterium vitis TaxID=373 RepID=UPI003D28F5F6